MSDFVLILKNIESPDSVVAALRDRPFMRDRPIVVESTPFGGTLVFQRPHGNGYELWRGSHGVIAAAGRPRIIGVNHAEGAADGFGEAFARIVPDERSATLALAGMGACIVIERDRARIFTDRLGSRPVYAGRDSSGRLIAVGTLLEPVARLAGRALDLDRLSLAELLVFNAVTFPYTTRRGVRELAPASCATIRMGAPELSVTTYWEPSEPESWPEKEELTTRLTEAICAAGDDTTLGCQRVAVALSGGRDSRAVLGAVPRDRLCCGLTYVCRMNKEIDVAGRIAAAFGVRHILCHRSEDFYEHLLSRGTSLLGTELRGHAHGLCVPDSGLTQEFDLLLGGQLSDTLLKDHFMPREDREQIRPKTIRERASAPLRRWRKARRTTSQSTVDRAAIMNHMEPEIRAAIMERRACRHQEIARIRPRTAAEWLRFWPLSRQDDSAHTLGNSRVMASETLFNHPAIIEIAASIPPELRWRGQLANQVFEQFYGPSAQIENANTGISVLARPADEDRAKRSLRRDAAGATAAKGDSRPWNACAGSWCNPVLLQKESAVWRERRERLARSGAAVLLDEIFDRSGQDLVKEYHDDLPATTCYMAVQLAWHFDQIMSGGSVPSACM